MQRISNLYTLPLSDALKNFDCCDDLDTSFQQLNDIIWKVSESNMRVKSSNNSLKILPDLSFNPRSYQVSQRGSEYLIVTSSGNQVEKRVSNPKPHNIGNLKMESSLP